MPPVRRVCAFCPRSVTGKGEHVWDDWINRIDGKTLRRKYNFVENRFAEGTTRQYAAMTVNATQPVACIPCNNGWMSELTIAAKAASVGFIRHKRPATLLPLGIAAIAAHTFMKAVVCNHGFESRKLFFLPSVSARFKHTLTPPRGVQVWLARFSSRHAMEGRAWVSVITLKGPKFKGFEFYLFTYVTGHLAVQLTCPRWTKRSRAPIQRPALTQADHWDAAAVLIWPDVATAKWPPPKYLDSDGLKLFRDRFLDLVTPV